jgi:hypothetical protein
MNSMKANYQSYIQSRSCSLVTYWMPRQGEAANPIIVWGRKCMNEGIRDRASLAASMTMIHSLWMTKYLHSIGYIQGGQAKGAK